MIATIGFSMIAYVVMGYLYCALTDDYDVKNILTWLPQVLWWLAYQCSYPARMTYKNTKKAYYERKRIPTATEVVSGVIGQAAIKHFDTWEQVFDRYRSGEHKYTLTHKQIKITRDKPYSFEEARYGVTFGSESVVVSDKLTKDLNKSWELFKQDSTTKEYYKREQKLLNVLEDYLK